MALGTFLIVAIIMAMAQQYSDSKPDYPEACGPLQDLGFDVIPSINVMWNSSSAFENIADIWILVSYALFFVVFVPFMLNDALLAVTRFFWCMSYVFGLRAVVVLVTRYPRLPFRIDNYHASNVLWGAILIVFGVRTTATDIMFSAHTVGWFMTASFVSRYSLYAWWSWLYWLFNLTGVFLLIAVREHYTSDVIVGAVLAKLVFWVYHLVLDDEYLNFLRPHITLVCPFDTEIALPATLVDHVNHLIRIEAEPREYVPEITHKHRIPVVKTPLTNVKQVVPVAIVPNAMVRDALFTDTMSKQTVVRAQQVYIWPSVHIYRFFKWLDGTL